jgi:hypothetical protein
MSPRRPIARPLALAALVVGLAATLRAQPSTAAPEEGAALALAVAKVAVNEASLASIRPAEVALIYQTAEARADTTRGRLRWLRAHSSCVLGERPLTPREERSNCVWTRELHDDDREPEGWPPMLSWARHAPRWAQVRELARRLVDGEERFRPCPTSPFSWGGRSIDMAHALERGLVPLDCRDADGRPTLNEGFALASGAS